MHFNNTALVVESAVEDSHTKGLEQNIEFRARANYYARGIYIPYCPSGGIGRHAILRG